MGIASGLLLISLLFLPMAGINPFREIGQPIDSLNHVTVYFNGVTGNVGGRSIAPDGYNVGLRYQCVEFVKRYYLEYLDHQMPESYGHAKDFFDESLADGQMNAARGLLQYSNPSRTKPTVDDIIVLAPTIWNPYGHVAIVARVGEKELEIIQQNAGLFGSTRKTYALAQGDGTWTIGSNRVMGWLRK